MSPVDTLVQHVFQFLQQHNLLNSHLTLAYSGGCDSQVLLHVLAKLRQSQRIHGDIQAIHIHHGLSDNADKWLQFTKQQAALLAIDYQAVRVEVAKLNRRSLEAEARKARYQALIEYSPAGSVVLTAHHVDDQIETMMLALKRGSGLNGLGAMSPMRLLDERQAQDDAQQKWLARPLLAISRADIEHYANLGKLTWVEDESNQDQRFDRNFLRQSVLPLLTQRWPHIAASAARTASHLQEAQRLLAQLADMDYQQCVGARGQLHIDRIKQLDEDRQNNLLRYTFQKQGLMMPSTAQLQQIKQLNAARADSQPHVTLSDVVVRRHQGLLYFSPEMSDISDWRCQVAVTQLPLKRTLPDGLGSLEISLVDMSDDAFICADQYCLLPIDNDTGMINFDFVYQNSKVWPHFRHKRRELKKVYQELQIPAWQRDRLLSVRINDMLAAVLGVLVNKEYLHRFEHRTSGTHRYLQIRVVD